MPAVPDVSILMVARNAGRTIDAALSSARRQTISAIEIVVVDDGSIDNTPALAMMHAQADPRVRVLAGPRRGLSAVRNASLAAATAGLALILDSDDLLHPCHVERLLAVQRRHGGQLHATDMITFSVDEGGRAMAAARFAQGGGREGLREIGPLEFIKANAIGGDGVALGYLKPLLDMNFLRFHDLHYDERLRIGEDFDLVLRCLLAGARYRLLPEPTYFYRRHAGSTSHRLDRADLAGLLLSLDAIEASAGLSHDVGAALADRRANLRASLLHLEGIGAIKRHDWQRAWAVLRADPSVRTQMLATVREALGKRLGLNSGGWPGQRRYRLDHPGDLQPCLERLADAMISLTPPEGARHEADRFPVSA